MNYEAIYNAVRSKLTSCDIGEAVTQAMREANISWEVERVAIRIMDAVAEYDRPSTVYKPKLFLEGTEWCALYGEDLQNGVAGFGKSPEEAFLSFDSSWREDLPEYKEG